MKKTNQPLDLRGTIFNKFWTSDLQENFLTLSSPKTRTRKAKKLYVVCGEPDSIVIVASMDTELQAKKLADDLNQRMQTLRV